MFVCRTTVVFPYLRFPFLGIPLIDCSLKILNDKFQKYTIRKFRVTCALNSKRNYRDSPQTWVIPLSSVSRLGRLPAVSFWGAILSSSFTVEIEPLFYLRMAPECKRSDAGVSNILKRSHKLLSLREKAKVLDLVWKEKNRMPKLLRSKVSTGLLSMKSPNL